MLLTVLLHEPEGQQRAVPVRRDDHVIQHADTEDLARMGEQRRQRDVLRAGLGISGGMVVDEGDSAGRLPHERAEDVPR